jgi:hypothetical protein
MADLLIAAENPLTIGNLLAAASETPGSEAAQVNAIMQSLIALINAGALTAA